MFYQHLTRKWEQNVEENQYLQRSQARDERLMARRGRNLYTPLARLVRARVPELKTEILEETVEGSFLRVQAILRSAIPSQTLKGATWDSDLPLIESRHVAGYNVFLFRSLKLGHKILRDGDLHDLIHVWAQILKHLLKDEI